MAQDKAQAAGAAKQGDAHALAVSAGFAYEYDGKRGVHHYRGFIEQIEKLIATAPVSQPAAQERLALSDAQIACIWHDLQSNGRSSYLTYARAILAAATAPLSAPAGSEQEQTK